MGSSLGVQAPWDDKLKTGDTVSQKYPEDLNA